MRVRNFRLYFFGQLVSQTGTWMTRIAQTLLVLDLTDNSGIAIGILTACQYAPVLLLAAWGGAVADRVDKRRLLLVVQSGAMLQSLVLGIAVATGHATFLVVAVLGAIQGALTAFENPARKAFAVEMVPDQDANNAISLTYAVMNSSRVFGPTLGGLIAVGLGYSWCFFIDAFSYIAVLGAFLMMRTSEMRPSIPVRRAKGQIREGLVYAFRNPRLRAPIVTLALVGMLAFNLPITVPLFVKGPLNGSDLVFSLLFSALSVGSVAGALHTARLAHVGDRQVMVSALVFGLALALFAMSPNTLIAFGTGIFVGYTSVVFSTSASSALQINADPSFRGRVLSIQTMVFMGSTPIGAPIVGLVADAAGPRAALLMGAAACVAAAAYARHVSERVSLEVA
jgi:MFS family permease